jgi:hypothetical protein
MEEQNMEQKTKSFTEIEGPTVALFDEAYRPFK